MFALYSQRKRRFVGAHGHEAPIVIASLTVVLIRPYSQVGLEWR